MKKNHQADHPVSKFPLPLEPILKNYAPKYFGFETCHGVARMPSPPPLAACYSATVSAPPPLILPLLPPPILLTEYTRCFEGKPQGSGRI